MPRRGGQARGGEEGNEDDHAFCIVTPIFVSVDIAVISFEDPIDNRYNKLQFDTIVLLAVAYDHTTLLTEFMFLNYVFSVCFCV